MTESFDISPVFQRYRVSHHAVAMMFAAGLEPFEIERRTAFTRRRLAILYADPTFQELITYYANREREKFVPIIEEVQQLRAHNALAAQRQLKDRLELADEEESSRLPVRELIAISADHAKTVKHEHSGSVDLNIAARLDRAIERSGKKREIEAQPEMKILEAQIVPSPDHLPRKSSEAPRPAPRQSHPEASPLPGESNPGRAVRTGPPRPSLASVLRRPKVA